MAETDERNVLAHIDQLVAEEHSLRNAAGGKGLDDAQRARLTAVQAQLDQCWDLLRQRRARSEYHEDPAGAATRSVHEVEGYQQ